MLFPNGLFSRRMHVRFITFWPWLWFDLGIDKPLSYNMPLSYNREELKHLEIIQRIFPISASDFRLNV